MHHGPCPTPSPPLYHLPSITSRSLEESGSYNAKNMIVINVVLVNVKTLLVVFCIMSPSCVSTLALPHHDCDKEMLGQRRKKYFKKTIVN